MWGARAVAVAYARNCSRYWWHAGENRFGFYPWHCACFEESVPRAGERNNTPGLDIVSFVKAFRGFRQI